MLAGGGERIFLGDETGLVEVSAATGEHQRVGGENLTWCAADARANVVWFATPTGLSVFDLADRAIHTVVPGDVANLEVIIDWGNERLGGRNAVDFDVGVKVNVAAQKLDVEIGCDGDRAWYCYEEDMTTLQASVAEKQKLVGGLRIADAGYLGALASRGKQAALWRPVPKTPAPAKPAVDPANCRENPNCGELRIVPGTGLWLVTIANDRGDFYHEGRALWDPRTNEYVRIAGGKLERDKTLHVDSAEWTDYDGLVIAPSGVMSYQGTVFDAQHVIFTQAESAHACGFAAGGWRMDGT